MIQYPAYSEPHIKWNHIDGPLLYCRNGRIHWLTLWERLGLKLGFYSIEQLDNKHCGEV